MAQLFGVLGACRKLTSKTHAIPTIQFQDQQLTSYSGITILQAMFQRIGLKDTINTCFNHLNGDALSYSYGTITLLLIGHLYLGKRKLQDIKYYNNDPMVLRLLGLTALPDCSTVSRRLSKMDAKSVLNLRQVNRDLVILKTAVKKVRYNTTSSKTGVYHGSATRNRQPRGWEIIN